MEEDNDNSKLLQQCCLVGKLITSKFFSATTLKSILSQAWPVKKDFSVAPKRNNISIFSFEEEKDVKQVLQQRPWLICSNLLVINE